MTALIPTEQVFCNRYHLVRREAELSLEFFQWCRCAKRFHSENAARPADVSLPSEARRLLHRNTHFDVRRQDAIPIFLRLMFEDVPEGIEREIPTPARGFRNWRSPPLFDGVLTEAAWKRGHSTGRNDRGLGQIGSSGSKRITRFQIV